MSGISFKGVAIGVGIALLAIWLSNNVQAVGDLTKKKA